MSNLHTEKKEHLQHEVAKMKKYIVEVEEPKKNQVVSTGGVREKGRMASQFKNPVPYEEPTQPPAICTANTTPATNTSSTLRDRLWSEVEDFALEKGRDLANMLWNQFCRPYIESKIRHALDKISARNTNMALNDSSGLTDSVIDVEAEEILPADDHSSTIIQFPHKQII